MKNVPKYFWRERGYVQQRVPNAFEADFGLLISVSFDLFFQCPYGFEIDLAIHPSSQLGQNMWETRDTFAYIRGLWF